MYRNSVQSPPYPEPTYSWWQDWHQWWAGMQWGGWDVHAQARTTPVETEGKLRATLALCRHHTRWPRRCWWGGLRVMKGWGQPGKKCRRNPCCCCSSDLLAGCVQRPRYCKGNNMNLSLTYVSYLFSNSWFPGFWNMNAPRKNNTVILQ